MDDFFPQLKSVQEKLHYSFADSDLLTLALTHRSFWNEHQQAVPGHNERLEFLGDAVLDIVISDYLYRRFPEMKEGDLSEKRSSLVDASACAGYLNHLGLEEAVLLGKGESVNHGKGRSSICADAFEALIGAIYLDGGLEEATRFFFYHFESILDETLGKGARNPKAELQDVVQRRFHETPVYEVIEETGPSHEKQFVVIVLVQGTQCGEGRGNSKKEAQNEAAYRALEALEGNE